MMSGRSPFLGSNSKSESTSTKSSYDTVSSIIRRIKHGEFHMDGDAWKYVSPAAKSMIKGLLTVDVKKRLTMDVVLSSTWINSTYQNNNNNPPSLLMTPLVLNEPMSQVIDRNLRQTFNAYHTVARELTAHHSYNNHNCLLMGVNHRSSSISSSSSSLSSGGASSISSSGAVRASKTSTAAVQDLYLHSNQFLSSTATASQSGAATALAPPPSVSIAPLISSAEAAFSGVSYQLMPSYFSSTSSGGASSATNSVSITKMGPMTRSRKRKMQDTISSVTILPTSSCGGSAMSISSPYHNHHATSTSVASTATAAALEIVTVTKRDRTNLHDSVFPASTIESPVSSMQYCATARAVVMTATSPSVPSTASWTQTANSQGNRSVTITID